MTKLELHRDGELYLIQRAGLYYIHGMLEGKRVRRSCKTKDFAEAAEKMNDVRNECASGWRPDYDDPGANWKTVAGLLHRKSRASAAERQIPFDLEPIQIFTMMKATDFRCAVSGIRFSRTMVPGRWRDPWAPSIDRIENRHGYTTDNVRVVSLIANTAMNAWGYEALLRLSKGVVRSACSVAEEEKSDTNLTREPCVTSQVIEFKREV